MTNGAKNDKKQFNTNSLFFIVFLMSLIFYVFLPLIDDSKDTHSVNK